jgi:hypothetical protein
MFNSQVVETVGQLRKLLEKFPDDKALVIDDEGNTWPPEFYNWAEEEDSNENWPLGIRAMY